MGSASFLVMFLWWITLYHFLRLLLFFIGSYYFSTYKKLMIWCLFLLTSIEMFGIIHVAICNRACRNKLKHGELSEWSKVQHSKCCVRNVPRVRIPNSPPEWKAGRKACFLLWQNKRGIRTRREQTQSAEENSPVDCFCRRGQGAKRREGARECTEKIPNSPPKWKAGRETCFLLWQK